MKNDQFAVYRVDRNSEGRDLWHLSYQEAVSRKLAIRIEYYRQMDIRPLLPGENAIALSFAMKMASVRQKICRMVFIPYTRLPVGKVVR